MGTGAVARASAGTETPSAVDQSWHGPHLALVRPLIKSPWPSVLSYVRLVGVLGIDWRRPSATGWFTMVKDVVGVHVAVPAARQRARPPARRRADRGVVARSWMNSIRRHHGWAPTEHGHVRSRLNTAAGAETARAQRLLSAAVERVGREAPQFSWRLAGSSM